MGKKIDYNKALSLLRKDPVMRRLIKQHGILRWVRVSENIFSDLIETIITQQLSGKAASTIFARFNSLFHSKPFPKPSEILEMPDERIRMCGTSRAKVTYIKNIAEAVVKGSLVTASLFELSDDEVVRQLTLIKGIGQWSAKMILMFSLGRQDIFSVEDLGIRNAVSRLYGVDRENKKAIIDVSLKWKPYRSIASCYLWKSLE